MELDPFSKNLATRHRKACRLCNVKKLEEYFAECHHLRYHKYGSHHAKEACILFRHLYNYTGIELKPDDRARHKRLLGAAIRLLARNKKEEAAVGQDYNEQTAKFVAYYKRDPTVEELAAADLQKQVVIIKDRSYSINRDKTQLDELINAYEDMDATPQASYVGEDSNDEPQDISPIEGIPSPSPPSSPVPLPAFRKGARLFGVPIPTSPETQSQPHTSEDDTEGEGYQRSQSVGLMSS